MVVGITGNIGSGKSLFAKELAFQSGCLIDADKIGHACLLEPLIQKKLVKKFGHSILTSQNQIDRAQLGRIVFSSAEKLKQLNGIVWPALLSDLKDQIREIGSNEMIWVDMAIIFESGSEMLFDKIIVITAPLATRRQWLIKKRGLTIQEADERIFSQLDINHKVDRGDIIIENTGSILDLKMKAKSCYQNLIDLHF